MHPNYWLLFIPYRFMESAVLEALRADGHDLPLNKARVIQRTAADGSRLADLAEAAPLRKQTAGLIVEQLERGVRSPTATPDMSQTACAAASCSDGSSRR